MTRSPGKEEIPRSQIHIIDDEERLGEVLAMVLRKDGHHATAWTSAPDFFAALDEGSVCDLLFTDLRMEEMDGLRVLSEMQRRGQEAPVVLITAHASVATAVSALQNGAFDYVEKPFDNDTCRALATRALRFTRLARENRYLRAALDDQAQGGQLLAHSQAMKDVIALARRAAKGDATVHIAGESGTGKELIARAIHHASDRVGQPFVAVNLRSLAPSLLESELFGHEKGAFTGADRARPGLFERADGGTLFLDEIGELPADTQAKLLRVLQERQVTRVGGETVIDVDVRVLSATWRHLQEEVTAGRFRADLFYRLVVVPITIPPLRDRPDDILPLARSFLRRAALQHHRPLLEWSDEAAASLLAHHWPGNVRELENVVERAVVLGREDLLSPADLMLLGSLSKPEVETSERALDDDQEALSLHAYLDQMARGRIAAALKKSGGAKAQAATALGIERTTLYRLMKKYSL